MGGSYPATQPLFDPPHVLRLIGPWIGFGGLPDLAFERIRHYAVADAAVSLRLMRALGDLASTIGEPMLRRRVIDRGKRLLAGCSGRLQEDNFQRLQGRLSILESGMAEEE
jgi:hypothetical protein